MHQYYHIFHIHFCCRARDQAGNAQRKHKLWLICHFCCLPYTISLVCPEAADLRVLREGEKNTALRARLQERQIYLAVVISTPEQLELQLTCQLAAGFLRAKWPKQTTQLPKASNYML